MNFNPDFLAAVADSDVCGSYYDLCREHPLRIGAPIEKAPATAVLKAAAGRISLRKLSGPGTVFQLGGLPEGVSLNFIVQSRTTVETDFTVPFKGAQEGGTFAIVCNAALAHTRKSVPNPPYPRPESHSLEELLAIFQSFDALVRRLASVAGGAR